MKKPKAQPGLPLKPAHLEVDTTIGRLDRVLSEFLALAEAPGLDDVDAQTLKHHADDLIGVGQKGLEILGNRRAAAACGEEGR
jgi:hypothetical protein